MNDTIRLGRIAGVPIGLNWTWAIVFVFFTWSLASSVFPAADSGLSGATYVAMGVAAALLFFASLLLHELGHAVVARREGITIDGITLWLFGGVARFRGSFPRAGVEFRIAIAGPAVTAVLALAFGAAARLTGDGGPVDAVVAWLGYVNLVLLGFNLLPAFPLDGGRVLRSALWRATGDLPRATRVSLATGRVVAMGMIAIGLVLFVRDGAFGDLWLALIGWFLLGAAKTEARSAAGRDALDGIAVADLMTPDPPVARADQQLSDFMDRIDFMDRLAWWNQHRAYPVVNGERAIGVLLLRDVAKEPQSRWRSLRVRDVMLPLADIAVVRADDAAVDARDAIVRTRNGLAVVVAEGGDLAGVLALRDMEPALGSRLKGTARSRPLPVPARRPRRVQPRNAR